MHDLLEGAAQYETKELLKSVVSEKFVTLEEVNSEIEHFQYAPPDILNKPSAISATTLKSSEHSVKQKGKYVYIHVLLLWCFSIVYLNNQPPKCGAF